MRLKDFTITTDETMTLAQFGRVVYKFTDCGPWIAAVMPDGTETYYEDGDEVLPDDEIQGLKIGSIVEGRGPYLTKTVEEFWETLERVNDEASDTWEESNVDLSQLTEECMEPNKE